MKLQKVLWCAASILLMTAGQASAYTFSSFQYPGSSSTYLTGIDDSGRIIGYGYFGFTTQGFMLTAAGSLTNVNVPGYVGTLPTGISRIGGIVGTGYDGASYSMFQDNSEGFGSLTGLLIDQYVTGVNSSFNIVGNYTTPSLQTGVYIRLNGAYYTLSPAQKCNYVHDPAINDANTVVGSCLTLSSNSNIGFIWSKGSYTFFMPPAGVPYMQPTSINRSGLVAGFYIDVNGFSHGFTWDGTTFTTIDYNNNPAANTQILGINNAGKIVGTYNISGITGFSAQ